MKVYILAGGKGSRLSSLTQNNFPKPMILLNDKPLLEHTINFFKNCGINEFIISVGYLHEKIIDYFKDGKGFGVNIEYIIEEEPIGSGGALFFLKNKIDGDFIVCSGDLLFDIDLTKMIKFHNEKEALITMLTHPNNHPFDSDLLFTDNQSRVISINSKNAQRDFYYNNLVNAGIYIVNSKTLKYFETKKMVHLESDFIRHFINTTKNVFSYKTSEYVKDVGTVERFLQGNEDFNNNIVHKKSYKQKQKAIFLDRDGVINEYRGFITNHKDIELIERVPEAIKLINKSEYLAIIVSNQPVIARGDASFDDVDEIFKKIETLLGRQGAFIDGIYYCPHHPDSGYAGEIKSLKIECDCRKPKIGMLLNAVDDFNLDLEKCIIIGDSNRDILTGKNANIKTIRVLSGEQENIKEISDYTFDNLFDAVNHITKGE